jgi:hypothetical protein
MLADVASAVAPPVTNRLVKAFFLYSNRQGWLPTPALFRQAALSFSGPRGLGLAFKLQRLIILNSKS